jgi:parvulin-like peptidyl-prolyl isomerase
MAKSNTPPSPGPGKGSQRNQPPPTPSWRDRIGSVFTSGQQGPTPKKRRVSRKERDDRRTRFLYIALSVLGVAVILMLSGAALNEYFLKPRKVLASVEGEDITRRDYWKYESHSLIIQTQQYQQYASLMQGQQQQQYLAMAQQAQARLDEVWGSTSVDDATLTRMVDDKVTLLSLDTLGLSVSDAEVDEYIAQQFASPDAPVVTPTPTQTLIPQRAEWATQTAVALTAEAGTPAAVDGSPVPDAGSPVAVDGSPTASHDGSPGPAGSPIPVASPVEGAPEPTPTVEPDDARATSAANFDNYQDLVLSEAHMSVDDYRRLIAMPTLAREKVNAYFTQQLGQSAEQVHAAHILVGTRELADSLYAQLQEDADQFAHLASEASVDTATAPNGGDLGWFTRGIMVEAFEEVAFGLPPGTISEPFQTEFGWHIVQVIDHENDRALTDAQIQQSSQSMAERWLNEQHAALDVTSSAEPTPTQSIQQFVPPPDAPQPPTPTPEGTPAASPAAQGSPEPVASPPASPAASPSPVVAADQS